MIRLFSPKIDKAEVDAAQKVIESKNWASGSGAGKVLEFEKEFCKYLGSEECVAVNNGTAALHLAVNLLDVKGKDVLVPSLTFITSVHSIVYNGGRPVFVDVDPLTMCIDPTDLENKVTKKTVAVMPVHFGGFPCNMNQISKVARRHNIHVIEDAAHAAGATYDGKKIGAISELTCFSFHPVKNLAMPKGGAITINHKNISKFKKKLNSLRWCGIDRRRGPFYDITSLGFNHYMDEVSAAIGLEQLKKLDDMNRTRFEIAKRYNEELKVNEKMSIDKNSSYHLYWMLVKNRTQFMKGMSSEGIETGAHYTPAHKMTYYKSKSRLPITEEVGKKIVTLPMHANLSTEEVDRIIKTANSLL